MSFKSNTANIKMGRNTHNSQKSEISIRSQEVSKLNEGFIETSKSIKDNLSGIEEIMKAEDKSTQEKFDWVAKMLSKIDKRLSDAEEDIRKTNTKFDTAIFDPEDGLGVVYENLKKDGVENLEGITKQLEAEKQQRSQFEKQVEKNTMEMTLMKGIIQRQHKQIQALQNKVTDITARGMSENLILSGLYEEKNEDLVDRVAVFLYDNMNIDARYNDFGEVYRLGMPREDKIRPIVFQCTYDLRNHIIENTGRLKGIGNGNGGFFFISQQQPEAYTAERKNLGYATKLAKEANKKQKKEHQAKIEIKNKKLYINGQIFKQKVSTPKPVELFVNEEEQEQMDKLKFYSSNPKTERGSQFLAAAVQVKNQQELTRAYRKAMQLHPCADHIMMAANINREACFQDDGEHNASAKMHAELMSRKIDNIAVFVIRNFGGRHLGPMRFECISYVANEALDNIQKATQLEEFKIPSIEEDEEED